MKPPKNTEKCRNIEKRKIEEGGEQYLSDAKINEEGVPLVGVAVPVTISVKRRSPARCRPILKKMRCKLLLYI